MKNVKITPLSDRVVVRPLTEEESGSVSVSGIILPESAKKEQAGEGVVIAVGSGKLTNDGKLLEMSVKENDRIFYSKYGFDEVKVDDKEYFVVSESSILAIIG